MKKLFTLALGTLMVIGLAACGQKERSADSFDDTVIKDGTTVYGLVGPAQAYVEGVQNPKAWGDADASWGAATAVSLRTVAQKDIALATKLEGMKDNLKGLYAVEKVELGHQALAGYKKGGYKNGEYVEVDGVYTVKFAQYVYDDETQKYAIGTWVPSPEGYSESLTPDRFWPHTHSKDKDEHGLDHNSDAVNFMGAGEYTYYLAVYKKAQNESYFGIGVHQDKQLSEYVAPEGQPSYCLVGQWNGWKNSDEAMGAELGDTLTITVAANDNGRFVEFGSWTTKANIDNVTTGANLVESDGGADGNFKFLEAGTYSVKLTTDGSVEITVAA